MEQVSEKELLFCDTFAHEGEEVRSRALCMGNYHYTFTKLASSTAILCSK